MRATKERLRSGQRAGRLATDADLDLVVDFLHAPLIQRWPNRSGPLDDASADATLRAFGPR